MRAVLTKQRKCSRIALRSGVCDAPSALVSDPLVMQLIPMEAKTAVRPRSLRSTLLELARRAVETEGHEALSLRALAAEAGVAPSAPYRHFPDRAALLQAVAEICFEELLERYADAIRDQETPADQLAGLIRSLVEFGLRNPNLFQLMFGSERLNRFASSESASAASDLFEAVLEALPASRSRSTRIHALSLASALRGVILAELGGFLEPFGDPQLVEHIVNDIIMRYSDR